MTTSALPTFGEADLSNCEREPIHLAGSIQPHGALLRLDDEARIVIQASANAPAMLNLGGPAVGRLVATLPGSFAALLPAHLDEPLHRHAATFRCRIGEPSLLVEASVHRPPDGGLIVEFEPAGETLDLRDGLVRAERAVNDARSLRTLADNVATLVSDLAGYDRVMVYRFDELGHGEVFSECRRGEHEAFLGNRYPASDIPEIARRLYVERRIRLLVDVAYEAVPLEPRLCPLTGRDLDMSMCALRSMSPVHLQYLKNMGVKATLVISLVIDGSLWGLIACHHYAARFVPYQTRAFLEILAELVATRIAALAAVERSTAERQVRHLAEKLDAAAAQGEDWRGPLLADQATVLGAAGATGAALICDGEVLTLGTAPDVAAVHAMAAWLENRPAGGIAHTSALAREAPQFAPIIEVAAGLCAVSLSQGGGMPANDARHRDWMLWFRPERVRTVTWGGDPTKPVIVGADPRQLSPRLSFAQWFEVVEGTCDPWTPADLAGATALARAIAETLLKARSIAILVAQERLGQLARQVRGSPRPMLVADPSGRVTLLNEAFAALLPAGQPAIQRLDDLPRLFAEPFAARRHVEDLLGTQSAWHGEIALVGRTEGQADLLIAADAVFGAAACIGYIVRFDTAADRKAAELARRHFGQDMLDRHISRSTLLDWSGEDDYRIALEPVIENAKAAALALAYGTDPATLPRMLASVRGSVDRSADLIERLVRHANAAEPDA